MVWEPVSPMRNRDKSVTGVRVGIAIRTGIRVWVADDALAWLAPDRPAPRFSVYVDRDPAMPRLRVVRDDAGRYGLARAPRGDRWRGLYVGRPAWLTVRTMTNVDCAWQPSADHLGIDIDLPPAFRTTGQVQPVGAPGHSGAGRPASVTVAATGR